MNFFYDEGRKLRLSLLQESNRPGNLCAVFNQVPEAEQVPLEHFASRCRPRRLDESVHGVRIGITGMVFDLCLQQGRVPKSLLVDALARTGELEEVLG